uniref:Uncharacterized protein n=1 Tax=Arundo donax TaxID=35708 RepID=A0A0A9G361_ARUDO
MPPRQKNLTSMSNVTSFGLQFLSIISEKSSSTSSHRLAAHKPLRTVV